MSSQPENFLSRWSRRKLSPPATQPVMPATPSEPPPALPSLQSVTFESDFTAFMHAKVDEGVRRAALRKLFGDPRFNVMDGLDIYIDDYSIEDPIPAGMLEQLQHARTTLFGPPAEKDPAVAEEKVPAEASSLADSTPNADASA